VSATLFDVHALIHRQAMMFQRIDLDTTLCSVGFFTGFLVSSMMIAVFGGVTNAIIVCFADLPNVLEKFHPVSVLSIFIVVDATEFVRRGL
jgi:hypothetical protein